MMLEHRLLTRAALPERNLVTPERSLVTPEHSLVTPERSLVTPERSLVTPERSLVTPERSLLNRAATVKERCRRILSLTLLASTVLLLAGCGGSMSRNSPLEVFPDMDRQGKFKPQTQSALFGDKRGSRMPVAGTVAIGYLKEDDAFYTGIVNQQYIGRNPLKIDAETLKLGQTKFNTYCSPCHDRTGHGQGIVGQRSSWIPANLHEDRARGLVDGELFDVITHGRRSMPPYRFQITERDRWAIVAYVRALQRTDAKVEDVPQELRSDLR